MNYPPCKIISLDGVVNVLQLTDLHLLDNPDMSIGQNNCRHHFEAVLQQALHDDIRCDLILVTGDLVNEVKPSIYDYIFDKLSQTGIDFACIAGNHDVTDEIGEHLPFEQRQFVSQVADSRLLDKHVIQSATWQFLLINSSIPGKVSGEIFDDTIDWLQHQLMLCQKPALLALHHHVVPVHSEWVDQHIATNTQKFWQMLRDFDHLKIIINGHTHQEQTQYKDGVTIYTTPSTCYQFKAFSQYFALDYDARPGYRWLRMHDNAQFESWVGRLADL